MAKEFTPQTTIVLEALCEQSATWRHGYDLARETGLKSGTLYPILIRLADRGLLDGDWEAQQPEGRPRRHLYRLTADGIAAATAARAEAKATPQGRRIAAPRGLAYGGA